MTSTTPKPKSASMLHILGWMAIRGILCIILASILALTIALLMLCIDPKGLAMLTLQTHFVETLQHASMMSKSVLYPYLESVLQHVPQTLTTPFWTIPLLPTHWQQHIWLNSTPIIQALLLGFKLYLVRLYLLLIHLPLIILALSTAFIDGLTQRTIRRHTMGRESALLYHQGKILTTFSMLFGTFLYLSVPCSIETLGNIGLITLLLTSCLLQITVKLFKKYL